MLKIKNILYREGVQIQVQLISRIKILKINK